MLLERCTVSRKTPGDGRLEVSGATADELRARGAALEVEYGGRRAVGRVESMACTCQKAAGGRHEHHFVASDLLKELPVAAEVDLRVESPVSAHSSAVRVAVSRVD